MRICHVTIENHKSFNEAQTLHFNEGFNLILGGNNAGKSTVLEALDLAPLNNDPHRSSITLPSFGDVPRGSSRGEVGIKTSTLELARMYGSEQFGLPITSPSGGTHGIDSHLDRIFLQDPELQVNLTLEPRGRSAAFSSSTVIQGSMYEWDSSLTSGFRVSPGGIGQYTTSAIGPQSLGQGLKNLVDRCAARVYRFGAQRRPGSECGMVNDLVLDREAARLPYFINRLQTSDAHGHRKLCEWVQRIFPDVSWVQSTPIPNNVFALYCLPHGPEARRQDLATPIGRMGTGIGNVVAILYVLLTAREPQVIAIDEPNAFLHPRALRELLAILESEGKSHQFILTAHSADVLTAVDTSTISFLDLENSATVVKQATREKLHTIRGELARLGISVTDLHGKDRVLWVEGQTEELVFPEVLRYACPEIAAGTAVLRVERTGTFEKKNGMPPDEIVSIYERLSTSAGLVPPMICVLLDAEKRKREDKVRIELQSKNRLRFLDRRMLESYLIEPHAIHAALKELGCECELAQVEAALSGFDLSREAEIDGAKVLEQLFSAVSNATQEFRKTRDVPTLVSWLIANNPLHLDPLRDFLRRILLVTSS